ncbi:hypothetical protein BH20ACI4_BH20ACI4_19510 [soil metagenome]
MLRKLFALSLFLAFTAVSLSAQDTPSPDRIYRALVTPGFGGSYLGVQTVDITKENFSRFGLSEVRGVAIDKVLKDSPAEKAGLQNNDVIVRFDGESVTSVQKLTRLIREVAPDHKVNLTVLRGGSERNIEVTMGKREFDFNTSGVIRGELPNFENFPTVPRVPNAPFPPPGVGDGNVFVWSSGANRQIGVTLTSLSKQLADYFGVTDGKGLLINEVRADSPAAKAGLKAGDVIVEADGKKVENNADLIKTLNEKKEGTISITVIRDKNRQTFIVEPEKAKEMNFVLPGNTENFDK